MKNAAEEADRKDGQPGRIVNRGTMVIGEPFAGEPDNPVAATSSFFGEVTMKPAEPWWIEQADDQHPAPNTEEQRAALPKREEPRVPLPKHRPMHDETHHGDDDFDRYCRIAVVLCAEGMTNDQAKKAATRVMTEVLDIDIKNNPNWKP